MAKKKEEPHSGGELPKFISTLSDNIGYKANEKDKPENMFNPFAIENTAQLLSLYSFLNVYSEKAKCEIPVPVDVEVTPSGKKVKFSFNKEIKQDIFEEIVDGKTTFSNLNIDPTSKTIELQNKN